jgi:dTDP-4-dehydrorhamnose 3,5-epimerase
MSGKILDVVCDLREDSKTFMKYQQFVLSAENMNELYIPGGFAHGFLALENSVVSYKCGECFIGDYDDGIVWNDKTLNIAWDIDDESEIIISKKDKNCQTFKEFREKYGSLK